MMVNNLHAEYTFENFVAGDSNGRAWELVSSAVKLPAVRNFPIYIFGASGLGKSHLLQAAANYIFEQNPQARLTYTTMENYCADVIDMLKYSSIATFKNTYEFADMLIIDDIQFLEGKSNFQDIFMKTFGYMQGRNKRVILASSKTAEELDIGNTLLAEKFVDCLTAEIKAPDYEMRMEILKKRSANLGLDVEENSELMEVLQMIAKYVPEDGGKLIGMLNRIVSVSKVMKQEIDMELAERVLLGM